jgi:hypothetical protein
LSCDEYTKNYLSEHLFWALAASWATPHLQAAMGPHVKKVSVSEFVKSNLSATSNTKKLMLKLPKPNVYHQLSIKNFYYLNQLKLIKML